MIEMEPASGRHQQAATTPGDRPGRRMGIERLVLILVTLTGALSLVSYRFHFIVRNYDTFIVKQVLPASGLEGWLTRNFGYDPAAYDDQWRSSLGSPYIPEFSRADPIRLNLTGSDYLDIWYHTREIVTGRNPYADDKGIVYLSHETYRYDWDKPRAVDPRLPDQQIGILTYPPMGPVLLLPFYLPNYFASLALYLAVVHVFAFALACYFVARCPGYRLPAGLLALTLFLTSYPLGLMIDRGNIEGMVLILTSLGLYAYGRGRPLIAAVLFGLAASGKVVPAIFLGLFLLDGRFKALLLSILVIGGATLAALLAMHDPVGEVVSQMLRNQNQGKHSMMAVTFPRHFIHSFFFLIEGGLFTYFPSQRATHIAIRLSSYYSLGILALTAVILPMLRRASFTNRVLVLTAMMLAFPLTSADYKLIHLYIPFGMIFVGAVRRGWATRAEMATLIILGIILSPKSYQFGQYSFGYYLIGTLLGVLILIGLGARFGEAEPGGARPVASLA